MDVDMSEKWKLAADACLIIPDFVADVLWTEITEHLTHYIVAPFQVTKRQYQKAWIAIEKAGHAKTKEGLIFGLRESMNDMGLLHELVNMHEDAIIDEDFYDKLPEAIESCFEIIANEITKTHIPLSFYASTDAGKTALEKMGREVR